MSDWQALAAELAQRLQLPAQELRVSSVTGGDINRALRLDCGRQSLFVKINRAELLPMFEAERLGLESIAATGAIRVPRVMLTGVAAGTAFIVMEFIELRHRPDAEALATAIAGMHLNGNDRFGFFDDNTIGSTPQHNDFDADWLRFWRRQRLGFQLGLLAQKSVAASLIDGGHRLADGLDAFFDNYSPRPSLLHGDLWSGNQAADATGNPVIYDPACYYGDHEAELAMMELFGSPGERFFAVYRERFAIDAGYATRRELYNLYHILNHANLFGGGYAAQAERMIGHLLAQL